MARFKSNFLFLLLAVINYGASQTTGAEIAFQQIYAFPKSAPDAWHPVTRLVDGGDGYLYGTTARGGSNDLGTIFKVTTAGALTNLLSFTGTNGQRPSGGLVLGGNGNFYGATGGNGSTDFGTVFQVTPGGVLTTFFSFHGTNGSSPHGRLEPGSDGRFYGTTFTGGAFNLGTAFAISTNGVLTTLISFSGTNGSNPTGGLIAGDNETFYGVTSYGGSNFTGPLTGNGTIFSITTNGVLTSLVFFNLTNCGRPMAALTRGTDGNFYGTASLGGANNFGTVFSLTPAGLLTNLVDFGPTGGVRPFGGVTEGSDGDFYGTTAYRASDSGLTNGTVFKVTTNGLLTTLINLDGTNGMHPFTDLVLAGDGNLYGTMADATLTYPVNGGTVFRLVPPPVITAFATSDETTTLAWSSFTNGLYRVERNASLTGTNWIARPPTITASNSTASFTEPAAGSSESYYRVILLP
jgi:uncharacterized repeat protein (TIGR03803 family)